MYKRIYQRSRMNVRSDGRKEYTIPEEEAGSLDRRYRVSGEGVVVNANEDDLDVWKSGARIDGDPLTVCAVADGMGGMLRANEASFYTIRYFREILEEKLGKRFACWLYDSGRRHIPQQDLLHIAEQSVQETSRRLAEKKQKRPGECGAAFSAVLLFGDLAVAVNVGDAPIFLVTAGENCVKVSVPDNLAEERNVRPWDPLYEEYRSSLTQYVGCAGRDLTVHLRMFRVHEGDVLMLGSDGAFSGFRDGDESGKATLAFFAERYGKSGQLVQLSEMILEESREFGGDPDDQSLILIVFGDPQKGTEDV